MIGEIFTWVRKVREGVFMGGKMGFYMERIREVNGYGEGFKRDRVYDLLKEFLF